MRERILNWVVSMAIGRRKWIYIVTVILTLIFGLSAELLLKFDMRWTEMLPENLAVAKEFNRIDENFLQPQNMIVVVRGKDPLMVEKITDEATSLLKEKMLAGKDMSVAEIKRTERYAKYVYGKMPEKWMIEHMLRLSKPKDAKRLLAMLKDPRLTPYLRALNNDFEKEYTDSENVKNQEREIVSSLDGIEQLVDVLTSGVNGMVQKDKVNRAVRDMSTGKPYTMSLDNTWALIMVPSALPVDDVEGMIKMDYAVERTLQPLVKKYPDYAIERTGMTAVGRNEMDSVGPYTIAITFGALIFIFFLLSWNFRSFLIPALALTPVVVGITWAMGFIALTIGTLNLITSMMMVVLLGLGIDFTIHIASRFNEEIMDGASIEESLKLTISSTGKGVVTGAVTTAIAFLALMIADTKAVWQFGFCAGTGVLLTLAATIWLLPALLASRAEHIKKKEKTVKKPADFTFLGNYGAFVSRRSTAVIILFILLSAAGILGGMSLQWEYNFMNLEPANLRSIELQDEIVDKFKFSPTVSLLSVKDVEESRKLRKIFKSKRVVGEVNDISLWVSRTDYSETKPSIIQLQKAISVKKPYESFDSPKAQIVLTEQLNRLWANLVELQALSITGGQDRVTAKIERIIGKRETRKSGKLYLLVQKLKNEKVHWKSVNTFASLFYDSLYARVKAMSSKTDAVTLNMVPEDILHQYKEKKGDRFLLQIYPTENLYSKDKLLLFQDVISAVNPHVTGTPQLILAMNDATLREGRVAMAAAILVIIFVLFLDFRKPVTVFLTILPVLSGATLMLGVMWIFGEKLNYINMIALPVILGIGVDDGVHLVHRYLDEGKGGIKVSLTSVGRAMLMTSVTTMAGFGSLMFYLMRGMASMGFVLFVGVGACYLITVTLLPALIVRFEDKLLQG
jgi:uncharacterized protein